MQAQSRSAISLAIAVVVPLALLGAAYAAWAISDQLGHIGPLDKAKFGWLVVIPLFAVTPIATGFAWRSLGARATAFAVISVALVVGAVVAATYGQNLAASTNACQHGTRLTSGDIAVAPRFDLALLPP